MVGGERGGNAGGNGVEVGKMERHWDTGEGHFGRGEFRGENFVLKKNGAISPQQTFRSV